MFYGAVFLFETRFFRSIIGRFFGPLISRVFAVCDGMDSHVVCKLLFLRHLFLWLGFLSSFLAVTKLHAFGAGEVENAPNLHSHFPVIIQLTFHVIVPILDLRKPLPTTGTRPPNKNANG